MKFFHRNIWNTEEDLIANYKNIYKTKNAFLTDFSFMNVELYQKGARKFWALGEGYGQFDLYMNATQRDYFEQEIYKWKANYFATDVFASFCVIILNQRNVGG